MLENASRKTVEVVKLCRDGRKNFSDRALQLEENSLMLLAGQPLTSFESNLVSLVRYLLLVLPLFHFVLVVTVVGIILRFFCILVDPVPVHGTSSSSCEFVLKNGLKSFCSFERVFGGGPSRSLKRSFDGVVEQTRTERISGRREGAVGGNGNSTGPGRVEIGWVSIRNGSCSSESTSRNDVEHVKSLHDYSL
jgi:hypothetical protein